MSLEKIDKKATMRGFTIEPSHLEALFEPDNILDQESLRNLLTKFDGIQGLLESLRSSVKQGVSNLPQDIKERQQFFGQNDFPDRKVTLIGTIISQFQENQMLFVLLIVSIVSTVIGISQEGWSAAWIEGGAILLLIVLVEGGSIVKNYLKFKLLLQEESHLKINEYYNVTRDEKIIELRASQLVVGDILHFDKRDVIPVDGILIEGSEILMDESTVTGEFDQIPKQTIDYCVDQNDLITNPFLICGSRVIEDSLQQIMKASVLITVISVIFSPFRVQYVVSTALAQCVTKMMGHSIMARNLASCEILGCINEICTDKTGTLTQNSMKVQKIYIQDQSIIREDFSDQKLSKEVLSLLVQSVCVTSSLNPENKVEQALIQLVEALGFDFAKMYSQQDIIHTIPFTSARKKLITIVKISNDTMRVFVKGTSEIILQKCTNLQLENKITEVNINKFEIINEIISDYANKSLRTIAIAYKDMKFNQQFDAISNAILESELTLLSIIGLKDPLRQEIPGAIAKCRKAGITVRMCTGDNIVTAVEIAKDAQIICDTQITSNKSQKQVTGEFEVMEGQKFRELVKGLVHEFPEGKTTADKGQLRIVDFEIFKVIAQQLKVLARCTPYDKLILVTGLQQLGRFVSVTGEGTNDAPTLKKADVGFAMGISGTETARNSAGIILLDDNFASIVTACQWGRNLYEQIRKFFMIQLTLNIVALLVCFISVSFFKQNPLNSFELLWQSKKGMVNDKIYFELMFGQNSDLLYLFLLGQTLLLNPQHFLI